MTPNKYAGDGSLYKDGERPESQARYIVYGYTGKERDPQISLCYPHNLGRNAAKRAWRAAHGVRK